MSNLKIISNSISTNTIDAGTLTLTGNETVGGTLAVSGVSTYSNNLVVTGNETVGGTLAVSGVGTFSNNLVVTGNEIVGGTLGVTGVGTFDNNLVVNGLGIFSNNLIVTENETIGGTLGVTGITTLSNNLIANANVFIPNITKLSRTENTNDLVYDTVFNRIVARPTSNINLNKLDDRFEYINTNWVTTQSLSVGNPVFDGITGWLSYPSSNDTLGTIISSNAFRFRMNNTNDIYCNSSSQIGMYIFIPSSATARNYFLYRAFGAYKSANSNSGFTYYCKFGVNNLNTTSSIYLGLVSPSGNANPYAFDGSNTLTSTVEACGFLLDHSVNSNYKLRLLIRKASVTTTHETNLTITTGVLYDLKIFWNYDSQP